MRERTVEALVRRGFLMALTAALCVACASTTPVPSRRPVTFVGPSLSVIEAEPALALAMPRAHEVASTRQEHENSIEGPSGAWSGKVFEVPVAQPDVFSYYDAQLVALGWVKDFPPTSTWSAGRSSPTAANR